MNNEVKLNKDANNNQGKKQKKVNLFLLFLCSHRQRQEFFYYK